MSQSASHYGRPGQLPYNYGSEPYPPAGGEPSRYYTPAPQMNPSASPSLQHTAFSPPPQQAGLPYPGGRRTSNNFYSPVDGGHDSGPPQHGSNAPFYVVGQAPPGTQLPGGPQGAKSSQRPQPNHLPSASSGNSVDGPTQPQELATSIYDSPLDVRPPQGGFNPSQPPAKVLGQERVPSPSQPPGQSAYSAYQGYQSQRPLSTGPYPPQQPLSAAPNSAAYPEALANNGYPALQSASSPLGAGSTAYQAYASPSGGGGGGGGGRPPQNYYTQQHEPPAPTHSAPPPPQQSSAPPHEYYTGRQNELFLPPGSRAQS